MVDCNHRDSCLCACIIRCFVPACHGVFRSNTSDRTVVDGLSVLIPMQDPLDYWVDDMGFN